MGEWTVSNPYPPAWDFNRYYAAEWIGIDGDGGSKDVFQAGTATDIWANPFIPPYPSGTGPFGVLSRLSCYAWWEWYPDHEVGLTNFQVSPGDAMLAVLQVISPTSGSVYLLNKSSRVGTSFTIYPPAGISLVGNCAEWIVERPSVNGSITSLADYDEAYFDVGLASWGSDLNSITSLGSGKLVTMVANDGTPLSTPTIETPTLMKMNWLKSN